MSIALNVYYKGKNSAAKMFMEEIKREMSVTSTSCQ